MGSQSMNLLSSKIWKSTIYWLGMSLMIGVVILVFTLYLTQSASAASITVNSYTDVVADDGQCALREAITAANMDTASGSMPGECPAGSGADVVNVPGGTIYFLSEGEILIFSDMEIIGEGRNSTVIDAAGTSNIFYQTGSPNSFTIRDLSLRNSAGTALQWGGSIGSGLATVENVLFYNNSTTARGGAIFNQWELSVVDSSFQSNRSTGGPNNNGGAIYNTGTATITNSEFLNNQVDITTPSGGLGGAISGGGLTIVDSNFVGNQAKRGGALGIGGTNRISNSTFSSNSTQILNSGAIFVTNTGTSIINSTVSQNTNGGIEVQTGGELYIQSSTFYHNSGAPNIYGAITIKNSLLYSLSGGTNCSGTITSGGYNWDNNSTCTLGGTGDVSGVDPMLGQLLDNGGPTRTHALEYGSPAIDAGNPSGCTDDVGDPILTDQRGLPRAIDGNVDGTPRCDIGAYELEPAMIYLPLILR